MGMGTRILGRTGLEVGVVGLGTEHLAFNRENMDAVLNLAVPAGVNYIDLVYNDPLDAHADYWQAIGPAVRRHRERLALSLHWGFVYHEPVEFNVSQRGLNLLAGSGLVAKADMRYARNVLSAAALTYVAALAQALGQVLYSVLLLSGGRRRRR